MNPPNRRSPRMLALVLASLVLVPSLAACGSDEPPSPVTLEVTVQDWSGWTREQPDPETFTKTLGEQEGFTVDVLGGPLTITVATIDDGEILIETSDEVAPRNGSGADHNDLEDTFTLDRGDEVEFSTPTLDAGTTVTIAEA